MSDAIFLGNRVGDVRFGRAQLDPHGLTGVTPSGQKN